MEDKKHTALQTSTLKKVKLQSYNKLKNKHWI